MRNTKKRKAPPSQCRSEKHQQGKTGTSIGKETVGQKPLSKVGRRLGPQAEVGWADAALAVLQQSIVNALLVGPIE